MTDQEIWDILKILAALLHMGNIKYKGKVVDNLDATDIPDQSNVERVAAILGVNSKALVDALTSKTIFAHGESVVSTLNTNQGWNTPNLEARYLIFLSVLYWEAWLVWYSLYTYC